MSCVMAIGSLAKLNPIVAVSVTPFTMRTENRCPKVVLSDRGAEKSAVDPAGADGVWV